MMQLYFVALVPPPVLREEIRILKEEIRERFGARHALKSPAHITLQMPFKRDATAEEQISQTLTRFASATAPFPVVLSGFDHFSSRVLFVKVADHPPIIQLHHQLQATLVAQAGLLPEEVQGPFHPHLTLATRDLHKAAFRQAWPEFQQRSFAAAFEAKSLFLLKHTGRHWALYREFLFGQQP